MARYGLLVFSLTNIPRDMDYFLAYEYNTRHKPVFPLINTPYANDFYRD